MYSGTNGSGATANASQRDHARPLIAIVFTAPFVRCHFLFLANSFLVRHSWGILLCIIFSPDTYYLAILSWLLTAITRFQSDLCDKCTFSANHLFWCFTSTSLWTISMVCLSFSLLSFHDRGTNQKCSLLSTAMEAMFRDWCCGDTRRELNLRPCIVFSHINLPAVARGELRCPK